MQRKSNQPTEQRSPQPSEQQRPPFEQKSLRGSFENLAQYPSLKIVLDTLQKAGFQAVVAGGAVRDALLGREFHDIDIATNALPEQVLSLFQQTVAVGKNFGVIIVQISSGPESFEAFEVATFRREENYADGRKPDQVEFLGCTAIEDAARRDFTINAMFYDLETDKILDYHQGLSDLHQKLIVAVGDSELRFREDHLRILRALRFSAQLSFEIEVKTKQALEQHFDLCLTCSRERISQELLKILLSQAPSRALKPLFEKKFFEKIGLKLDPARQSFCNDDTYWTFWPHGDSREFLISRESAAWLRLGFLLKPERESILQMKEELKLSNRLQMEALVLVRLRELLYVGNEIQSPVQCGEVLEVIFSQSGVGGFLFHLLRKYDSNAFIERLAPFVVSSAVLPAMTVKAAHLKEKLFGAKLGEALRRLYWIQLYFYFCEQKILSAEELLVWTG